MSHFDTITEAPDGLRRHRHRPPTRPVAALEDAEPRPLRRAVPPRGRAHARTARSCSSTSSTTACGCQPTWTMSVDHRDVDRRHPRPGRRRPGHLRAVRRRRLGGGRRARAPGHRAAAHVRVRRHRADAPGRGRAGRRDLPPPPGHRAHPRARRPTASSSGSTGVIDPEEKRKTIGELFIRVFEDAAGGIERRRLPRAGHALPRRHRVGHVEGAPRSRATTTWAACPRTWTSSWSSRCAACSRTRSARSAPSSACPTRSCGASRSPGPGLGVRIIGEVTPEQGRHPAARRRHRPRGDPQRRPRARDLAGVRRAARHPQRRRDGRRAHLRLPDHHPGGHQRGRHDRRLGPPALRPARAHVEPHHQRGRRASTGWPTTSRRSRPAPSSGSRRAHRPAFECSAGSLCQACGAGGAAAPMAWDGRSRSQASLRAESQAGRSKGSGPTCRRTTMAPAVVGT